MTVRAPIRNLTDVISWQAHQLEKGEGADAPLRLDVTREELAALYAEHGEVPADIDTYKGRLGTLFGIELFLTGGED